MPPDGLQHPLARHAAGAGDAAAQIQAYAALAYARANKLNRIVIDGPKRRFGIVTTGKSYLDVRQALDDLGIDEAYAARDRPLHLQGRHDLAAGARGRAPVRRGPRGDPGRRGKARPHREPAQGAALQLEGERAAAGHRQVRRGAQLDPALGRRADAGAHRPRDRQAHRAFPHQSGISSSVSPSSTRRKRRSTAQKAPISAHALFLLGLSAQHLDPVPEGSRALAGIGCHYMVQWMDRSTDTFTQMGGEGATWIGQAPFSKTGHVFQNLGDGTYYHSGLLAIRACVAASVNITYKILYNDAVAMTGGQPMDGPLDVPMMAHQVSRRGREAHRHRQRRAGEVSDRRRASRRAPRCITATTWTGCSAISARSPASPSSSTTRPARPRSGGGASAA